MKEGDMISKSVCGRTFVLPEILVGNGESSVSMYARKRSAGFR